MVTAEEDACIVRLFVALVRWPMGVSTSPLILTYYVEELMAVRRNAVRQLEARRLGSEVQELVDLGEGACE